MLRNLVWRRRQEGWLEFGCKRDKGYGGIGVYQIEEAGKGSCMEIAEAALLQVLSKIFYYDKIALLKFVHSTEMRNIYAAK